MQLRNHISGLKCRLQTKFFPFQFKASVKWVGHKPKGEKWGFIMYSTDHQGNKVRTWLVKCSFCLYCIWKVWKKNLFVLNSFTWKMYIDSKISMFKIVSQTLVHCTKKWFHIYFNWFQKWAKLYMAIYHTS